VSRTINNAAVHSLSAAGVVSGVAIARLFRPIRRRPAVAGLWRGRPTFSLEKPLNLGTKQPTVVGFGS
jgi:hypothetical protein